MDLSDVYLQLPVDYLSRKQHAVSMEFGLVEYWLRLLFDIASFTGIFQRGMKLFIANLDASTTYFGWSTSIIRVYISVSPVH